MPPTTQAAPLADAADTTDTAPKRLRTLADLSGPPGLPIVGNALQMDRHRIHQNMEALCQQYGPFFKVRFASRTVLVVGDHEASAKILKARPNDFRRSMRLSDAARSLGLDMGLFMAEGDTWNRQRRMVMASFAPQRIRAYFPSMLNVTRRLHDRWVKAAQNKTGIDLQADLMRYTVDTITGLALGHDVNTIEADGDVIQKHLDVIFPAMFKRILSVVPYWKLIKLPADREVERHVAEVNRAIDGFVKQARTRLQDPARRADPSNLLEALIVAAESEDGGVSDADVRGNVMTMLLAGEDTTANTLAWLIYLLKQNPATLARARQEVQTLAPRGLTDFTPETMAQLDYIEACANEAMRLKPVAPFLPVQAMRDLTVADIAVPKGTLVWNALRTDSVSAQHVNEPQAFQPERWLGSSANQVKHVAMPFGSGPRICPGRYLALLEIKMALAMLLSHFDIEAVDTPDGDAAREVMAFTMGPENLTMHIQKRASA
ncbi:MAG: cytochrome P450 [Aquabacterium sp.]